MVVASNGLQVTIGQVIGGALQDTKEKPLNFKIERGASSPSLIARGKDGQIFSVPLDSAIVTVSVAPRPDYKQLRKEGRPIPRDKADKIDKQLEKERKRQEKVASGEMSAEDAAKETEKERQEEQKEQQEEIEKESGSTEEAEAATLAEREPEEKTGHQSRRAR